MFSLIFGIFAQYKYKQYCIYIEIYTGQVTKSETGRGDQGRRKRRKGRQVNTEVHHICVGARCKET
jgi:hypothetical protein